MGVVNSFPLNTVEFTGGTGDFSSDTATSVDGEMLLFSGTDGKTGKRSTLTGGLLKSTSGVPAIATAGTDYAAPSSVFGYANSVYVSNTSIPTSDKSKIIYADATAGAVDLTLPSAASFGVGVLSVAKVDIGSNIVRVYPPVADSISGMTKIMLPLFGDNAMFASDGSTWRVVGPSIASIRHTPIVAEHTIVIGNSPYSIDESYNGYIMIVDATGGNITLNLPKADTVAFANHQVYTVAVKKYDTSANTVSIVAFAGDAINGPASPIILTRPYETVWLWTDGARWYPIARESPSREIEDGTAALPSLFFRQDTDSGIYRLGANSWGLSAAGALQLQVTSGGIALATPLATSSGGTALSAATSTAATFVSRALSVGSSGSVNDSSSGSGAFVNHTPTVSIPASFITTNRVLKVTAMFRFTTGSAAPSLEVRMRLGGTTVVQYGTTTPANSLTARAMANEFIVLGLAAPGASANTESLVQGNINLFSSTTILNSVAQPVALATNGALTLDIGTQWNSAGTGTNTVTLMGLIVEALN